MRAKRAVDLAGVAAAVAGLAVAGWWSAKIAVADLDAQRGTEQGVKEAIGLTPDRGEYYAQLGRLTEDEDPAGSAAALRKAVELNPADSGTWIELGLRAEEAGDEGEAERDLLRAAEEDREYLPRWTLANYYFRHGETGKFWKWAKEAAGMAYGDARPLFRLCGQVSEDGRLMERLGIERPEVRAGYLAYLLNEGHAGMAGAAMAAVLGEGRKEDVPLLLAGCEQRMEARDTDGALEVWNGLAERGLTGFGRLDPAKGAVLTNGGLRTAPTGRGFDWRMPGVTGVSEAREDAGGGLRIEFSGDEPEGCEPLAQWMPVEGGTEYEAAATYRTEGIARGAGLRWTVADDGGNELAGAEGVSPDGETTGRLRFTTPAGCRMVKLALAYRRATGTVRVEGYMALRRVAVRVAR